METVNSKEEAIEASERLGFPLRIKTNFSSGGRSQQVVVNSQELKEYLSEKIVVAPEKPLQMSSFY